MSDKIAVVIPCYRVTRHILGVIRSIGPEVQGVFVVDDCCPEGSGDLVESQCTDPRVTVIRHDYNQGVGAAVMTGYCAALQEGYEILVKVDGDGQMDVSLIPDFVEPIRKGLADYTKGNRFFDLEEIRNMPRLRIVGNAVLSFMTKFSSGYWNVFDPTNGFTAIHAGVARYLPMHKISRRYFFESDMLFRLNTLRAVVYDIPMSARYGDEVSNLKISAIVGEFLLKHGKNFGKRIFYNYYLRDLSLASLELPLGLLLLLFGIFYGGYNWSHSVSAGIPSSAGTVMLSGLPVILGLQLLLSFLGHDIASVPNRPLHPLRRLSCTERPD